MDGSGAWVKQSQPEQALRGRTMRFTMKRPAAPLSRMQVDLSRFCSGQVLMLGGLAFEGHGAFPTQG